MSVVFTTEDVEKYPHLWRTQKPYPNGIVTHHYSVWNGNGFGTTVIKIAVRDGRTVAQYDSGIGWVEGPNGEQLNIYSDGEFVGYGTARRRIVTRSVLSKWIEAVKALPASRTCTCGAADYPSCLCNLTPKEWVATGKPIA